MYGLSTGLVTFTWGGIYEVVVTAQQHEEGLEWEWSGVGVRLCMSFVSVATS